MGLKLFGRSYEHVGKEGNDLVLVTKGKIKIKWGNKYIDLLKDGKLNVDVDFIKSVETEEDVHSASGNGIFVTNEGEVFIKWGDMVIPIVQDVSDTDYVSYTLQEGKTGEEKGNAQVNIGILANSLETLNSYGIQEGMAYISSERAIYLISGGTATKLDFKIPDPITDPVRIKINQGDYALFLEGHYHENGTKLVIGNQGDALEIYTESDYKHIDSSSPIVINIKDKDVLTIGDKVESETDVIIKNDKELITDTVRNDGGDKDTGFLLDIDGGESWLYVDNLIVRNDPDSFVDIDYSELIGKMEEGSLQPGVKYRFDFMNEWDMEEERQEDDYSDGLYLNANVYKLVVTAVNNNTLGKHAYFYDHPEWSLEYDPNPEDITIDGETISSYGRITSLTDEYGNKANFDFKHLRFWVDGEWKFLFQFVNERNQADASETEDAVEMVITADGSCTGEIQNTIVEVNTDNLQRMAFPNRNYTLGGDVILQMKGTFRDCTFKTFTESAVVGADDGASYSSSIVAEEVNDCSINTFIVDCNITYDVINKLEVDGTFSHNKMEGFLLSQTINGMEYCFVSGRFEDNTLPDGITRCYFRGDIQGQDLTQDGSGIFTDGKPTDIYVWDGELRTIRMPDTVFPGMIVMYDGRKPVPTGWAMCDGNNGTPNLIDRYIKASATVGEEGGNENNEVTIEIENLPAHTHEFETTSITTSEDGTHSHTIPYSDDGKENDHGNDYRAFNLAPGDISTSSGGAHTHTVDLSAAVLKETGGGQPIKIEPPYYTLIFIMYIGYSDIYY